MSVQILIQRVLLFGLLEISALKKKNLFDYERAHSHSSCYLATNKALLVIAVLRLAVKKKKKKMDKGYSIITDFSTEKQQYR